MQNDGRTMPKQGLCSMKNSAGPACFEVSNALFLGLESFLIKIIQSKHFLGV